MAIVAVMGLHAIDRLFPGGFYGVDVFFVLSAFLITSLILEELDTRNGRFSFQSFYWRRALRLGPALLLWLFLVAAPTSIAIHQVSQIPLSTIASLFYFGDFAVAAGLNLGDAYTHVWSLAIEEQFYAAWPFVLVFLLVKCGVETQRRILLAALPTSLVVSLVANHYIRWENYFLPTAHLVPLAAGCLAGYLFMRGGGRRLEVILSRQLVGPVCLAVIALVVVTYRPAGTEAGVLVILAVALSTSALILHMCLRENGFTAVILSLPPALWLGRRSYGLYLYHRTLAILVPALIPGITLRYAGPFVLLLSFLVAELSFRLVERPANRAGREWMRKKNYPAVRRAEFALPIAPGRKKS